MEKNREINTIIANMQNGSRADIIYGLTDGSELLHINGIINAVKYSMDDEEIISKIRDLKDDHVDFHHYEVSHFALAALDILGIEEYNGNSKYVKSLIECRLVF